MLVMGVKVVSLMYYLEHSQRLGQTADSVIQRKDDGFRVFCRPIFEQFRFLFKIVHLGPEKQNTVRLLFWIWFIFVSIPLCTFNATKGKNLARKSNFFSPCTVITCDAGRAKTFTRKFASQIFDRRPEQSQSNMSGIIPGQFHHSLFQFLRKSSPWGHFSDGGLNQSIKRRLSL